MNSSLRGCQQRETIGLRGLIDARTRTRIDGHDLDNFTCNSGPLAFRLQSWTQLRAASISSVLLLLLAWTLLGWAGKGGCIVELHCSTRQGELRELVAPN